MNIALLDAMPQRLPGKWPFPPPSSGHARSPGCRPGWSGPGTAAPAGAAQGSRDKAQGATSLAGRIADVAMVLAWGALIPGLMWLGHAAGF